jgi:hypothetical protein
MRRNYINCLRINPGLHKQVRYFHKRNQQYYFSFCSKIRVTVKWWSQFLKGKRLQTFRRINVMWSSRAKFRRRLARTTLRQRSFFHRQDITHRLTISNTYTPYCPVTHLEVQPIYTDDSSVNTSHHHPVFYSLRSQVGAKFCVRYYLCWWFSSVAT